MELAEKRYAQWLAQQGLEPELRQELDAMHSDAEKVTDAFYRDLEFGTAGLRGVLGAGTNRMNIYVIRRATQAVAQYLNETELPKTVAIGHDSRIKSDVFAREAAAVFAANGITAYLYPRLEPVPALSFAVRHLHCGLGVCVTASHNPAEYNGYKVYGSDGCQMTPEAAKRVVALLEHMDYFTSAKTTDFDAALAAGSIRYIPDEVLDAFVDAVYAQRVGSGEGIENLKLVYTPLNGAGLECVKKLTQKIGIRNMTIVKEQEQPDGHFPTCPYPNPEIRQAMELGLQYCDRVHPDILIGTDPDCDRCGTAVPDGKGGYRLISGNERIPPAHGQRDRRAPARSSLSAAAAEWHDAGKSRRCHHHRLDRYGHSCRQKIRRRAAPRAYGLQIYRRADRPAGAGRPSGTLYLRL